MENDKDAPSARQGKIVKEGKPGKGKSKQAKRPVVPQKEKFLRLNHLLLCAQWSASVPALQPLSRIYSKSMDSVAKKSVIRLSPNVKRGACKSCSAILIPGISCQVRVVNESKAKDPRNNVMTVKCCNCSKTLRFPYGQDPNYQLWIDAQENKLAN